jgi:hypothetical protein
MNATTARAPNRAARARANRAYVRDLLAATYPDLAAVVEAIIASGGDGRFYVIRQARTRVIGSPVMTAVQARREYAAWTSPQSGVGPARIVPVTPALRRAVRAYDQDVLVPLLAGAS